MQSHTRICYTTQLRAYTAHRYFLGRGVVYAEALGGGGTVYVAEDFPFVCHIVQ